MKFKYTEIQSSGQNDIYKIRITYNDDSQRTFTVKTNKGSVKISENDTEGKKALVELLGRQGLIDIDTPNEVIDLGTLIKQDGKLNIVAGKNYCCSDIKGVYELYMNAKKYLGPNDTLWILGDAIDGEEGGIDILKDIIANSKSNTGIKINYILGNHDYMMLQWINGFEKLGVTGTQVIEYLELMTQWVEILHKVDGPRQKKKLFGENVLSESESSILEEYEPQLSEVERKMDEIENKWKKTRYEEAIYQAMYMNNSAIPTMRCFYELPKEQQREIRDFLENSPLIVTSQFGDKKVALVHSAPPINFEPQIGLQMTYNEVMKRSDLSEKSKEEIIKSIVRDTRTYWENECKETVEERFRKWKNRGYITIRGHERTDNECIEEWSDGVFAIDAGAADGKKISLYCIEDGKATCIDKDGKASEEEIYMVILDEAKAKDKDKDKDRDRDRE